MLTAARSLALNSQAGPALPRVPDLEPLYRFPCTPRKNEMVMIAGRPGHQKSGFALWWLAQMGLPTLYFSADMSGYQASMRLACMKTGRNLQQVEMGIQLGTVDIDQVLGDVPITFSFGKPIRWRSVNENLEAYVDLWDRFPEVIVFDNLMDFEGGEADYGAQMEVLQVLDSLKGDTGATVMVLHHATDKGDKAKKDPHLPPPRWEIKGGLAEKPELTLGVALDPLTELFRVAVLKQRMDKCDPSGETYATLQAEPELTRFHAI